ncbi:hypothetical protein G4B88_014387, partial [Cannabis sativa]
MFLIDWFQLSEVLEPSNLVLKILFLSCKFKIFGLSGKLAMVPMSSNFIVLSPNLFGEGITGDRDDQFLMLLSTLPLTN